jgi:hypothetical protein
MRQLLTVEFLGSLSSIIALGLLLLFIYWVTKPDEKDD